MTDGLKITISGSYSKHLARILEVRETLLGLGAKVLRPLSAEVIEAEGSVRLAGDPDDWAKIREAQFEAIRNSDVLYIVNPGGYVGPAATLEAGYAFSLGLPIWSSEPPFEEVVAGVVSAIGEPKELLGDKD